MLDLTLLRRHPVLAKASSSALELIGGRGVLHRWTARQVIFRRGDAAYGMVLILSGRVRVVRVRESIRRMVSAHAPMLERAGPWRAAVAPVEGGVQFSVIARDPADTATQARIRGLGFIGLMVQGAHHAEHHLLIAKGAGDAAHRH